MNPLRWLGFIFYLSACTFDSVPGTRYYYLPDSNFIPPVAQPEEQVTVEVSLPSYLATSAMVIGDNDGSSFQLTTQNLWATELSSAIKNNLINHLNQLGASKKQFFSPKGLDPRKLLVTLEKFQGDVNGRARVIGYATLLNAKGTVIKSIAFREEARQEADGYPGMLEALNKALRQLSQRLYVLFQ
ncbi:MAG: ABC-type transport auxiliary lipoprotein family protein [Neisseriaceae bacterium]